MDINELLALIFIIAVIAFAVWLYKRLHKTGIICRLQVYSGCWHVFQLLPMPKAFKALDDVAAFIKELGI